MNIEAKAPHHVIHYTVDDEPQETTAHELTRRQIMENAGINPDQNYLVEIHGVERKSYQKQPDDPIKLHEHEKFVTVFTGTVPVS